MRITIEATQKVVKLNGATVRVWEGQSEGGVPVIAYIALISPQTHSAAALMQFNAELLETRAPSPPAEAIPLRLVL